MEIWLNGISEGVLIPSRMFVSESAGTEALQSTLERAKVAGCRVRQDEIADFAVWTIRRPDGSIYASYWLSSEEHGPAMRATR